MGEEKKSGTYTEQREELNDLSGLVATLMHKKSGNSSLFRGGVEDMMLMWEFGLRKCNDCVCKFVYLNEWKIITNKWAMIFMAGCGYDRKIVMEGKKDRKFDRGK